MHLGELLQSKLQSDEIVHVEERRNRQLRELGGANDEPRELVLNVPSNFCFDGRVHSQANAVAR